MKRRVISFLICLTMICSGLSGSLVFADTEEYNTIEDVLGVSMVASSNVWDFSNSTMTKYMRGGYLSIDTPDQVTFTEEGLDLGNTDGNDAWRFTAFRSWSPLKVADNNSYRAVYFKVKGNVHTMVKTPDNYSVVRLTSMPGKALTEQVTKAGGSAIREVFQDITPDENWIEYLMVPRNTNAVYLWAKSETLTNGKWVKVIGLERYYYTQGSSDADYNEIREKGINFSGSGVVAGFRTIDYNTDTRTVVASDEDAKMPGADVLWFDEEFESQTFTTPLPTLGSGVSVTGDGTLSFPARYQNDQAGIAATSGSLSIPHIEIPENGYAEIRVKSNGVKDFLVDDGHRKVKLLLYCDYSAFPGTVMEGGGYVADSDAAWRTWRFVRKENGYSIYSKADEDSGWRIHSVEGTGESSEGNKRISISLDGNADGTSDGNGQVDYIKIFGQKPEHALELLDGHTTNLITNYNNISYPENVYALAMRNPDTERKLVLAQYGENDILTDVNTFSVPKGTGSVLVPVDLEDKEGVVRNYKLFLWDGLDKTTPASRNISVKGNLVVWQDAWGLGGNAKVENETIILDTKAGNNSFAEWNVEIPDAFDISWSMNIEKYGQAENVTINTGVHCVSLDISANEISYLTNDGIKSTPWAIGNKKHDYRLLHKNGECHLLIDGFYVDVLRNIKSSSEESGIRFENQGGMDTDSFMRIEPIDIARYSSNNIPTSAGFYHTFESAEESSGWSFSPRDDGTGNEVSAWEIEDGYMQCVDFRTRKITSVAQRYFKQNVGDDYVFMARMQIPHFGTSGMLNIYLPYRSITLELKEKFFGMRNGASTLASSNNTPETIYSDPIAIDTSKWYDLRIETYDYCNKVRVFLNNEKIMDGEMSETSLDSRVIDLRSQSETSKPFAIKYDWLKCAPITYGVTVNGIRDDAVVKEGTPISLTATVSGTQEEVVSYRLSGNTVATGSGSNNRASIVDLPAGRYELTAVSGDKFSAPISFTVEENTETDSGEANLTTDINYANEIIYETMGSGEITFGNGNHLLKMTHSDGKVSYQTDDGVQKYELGTGKFCVITEGPVADVYRNGQFAFSFYMPMSAEKTKLFTGDAIGEVSATKERQTYFSAKNVTDRKKIYQLENLSHCHVVDFVADQGDQVHLALNDGYYRTNLSIENGDIYVWNGQRNNSLAEKIKISSVSANEAYYRIETSAGMSRLYKNGRWIGTFRSVPTVGEQLLSVNVTSGSLSYLAVCDNKDLYLHEDAFDGNGELDSEGYWMTDNQMEIMVDEEKEALRLESSTSNGIVQLSPDCGDVTLSADVMVESADGIWFIANRATDTSYSKIGYNFKTRKYEFIEVETTATNVENEYQETVTETVIQSKSGTFSAGRVTSMKLQVLELPEGKKVSLLVDGNQVLAGTSLFQCRGTVGFMVANGTAYLDNVSFRGDEKLVRGITDQVFEGSLMMDMIENLDTNEIYMLNSAGRGYATKDGGETWTEKNITNPVSNHIHQFYKDTELKNGTVLERGTLLSVSKNGNGTINGIRMIDDYGQAIYANYTNRSTDYGVTWKRYCSNDYFFPKLEEAKATGESNGATVNAFKQGYSGRFYYVANTGGNEDYGGALVWYSDNAKSWTLSETKILSKELGFVIAEAQVLETSKFTRLYFRTDMGSICYFESHDYGKTWDLTPHKTPFISVASCFNVEVDPLNPDVVYFAWVYDNTNLFARHQFPRMRWAVAKSVDAGETWEMLGTVHENNSAYHENSNMNLSVSSDYVIVSAQSSEYYRAVSPMNTRVIMFPKEGQRTSKRFEQLHMQYPQQIDNTKVMSDELVERTMVVQPTTGVVWIRGARYENAYKRNYISVELAAKLVGAKVINKDDGTISLSLGGVEIPFYSTELSVQKDGTYVSLLTFAERFGLFVTEEEEMLLISENQNWSQRQKKAFRYAIDLFSNQP